MFVLFIVYAIPLASQTSAYSIEYLKSYPQTVWEGTTAPLSWDAKDWVKAAAITGIAAGLYIYDEDINQWVQEHKNDKTKQIRVVAKQFGEGKYMLPAIALGTVGGLILHDDKTVDTGMISLKSFILANGTSQVLKFATQRNRPISRKGKQFFNGEGFSKSRESFPSGHATVAWSVAPVIAAQYKDSSLVPPLAYGIATLTSLSRMHDNKYWASDAFVGSMIGYLSAQLCLKTTPRFRLSPSPDLQGIGFSCNF